MSTIEKTGWECADCGALNAPHRTTCGKCDKTQELSDPIVNQIVQSYYERSAIGIKKYNTTLSQNNLSIIEWLNHLQEELMDATLYIEKIKTEMIKNIEVNEG